MLSGRDSGGRSELDPDEIGLAWASNKGKSTQSCEWSAINFHIQVIMDRIAGGPIYIKIEVNLVCPWCSWEY